MSRESRADFSASLQSLPFGNLWRLSVFLQVFPTTCCFSCRLYTRWWSRCRRVAVWQSRPESQPSYTRGEKPAPRRRPNRGRPKRRAEARNRPIRGFRSPDPAQPVGFPAGPGKHLQENRQVPNTYQTLASPMSSSHVVACPRSILSRISPSFAVVLSRSAAAGGGESRFAHVPLPPLSPSIRISPITPALKEEFRPSRIVFRSHCVETLLRICYTLLPAAAGWPAGGARVCTTTSIVRSFQDSQSSPQFRSCWSWRWGQAAVLALRPGQRAGSKALCPTRPRVLPL